VERGVIKKNLASSLDDIDLLSLQIALYYRQNRYRDIIRIGNRFKQNSARPVEGKKEKWIEILQNIGDSYQKIENLYDAEDFYKIALEVDPENIDILIRIRQIYRKLGHKQKMIEIDEKIERILGSKDLILAETILNKGNRLPIVLRLDGRSIILKLRLKNENREIIPLFSVFFNGRVVWENYLNDDTLSIPLNSVVGENFLEIGCINQIVTLVELAYN
jgi:tetratricopeptide (TPR) repeat protein